PNGLPLLHRMEERAGERRRVCFGSPLSSILPMNPWEHRTSNIQHPTANQWHWKPLVVRYWMLGVGCFPSVHGFNARIFRGILSPILSPSEGERENHLETDGVADGLRSRLVLVFANASAIKHHRSIVKGR